MTSPPIRNENQTTIEDSWRRVPTPSGNTDENEATMVDGWNRPATPLPATTYTEPNHARLHWSHCTDDGCLTHYDSKINNNYWPQPQRHRTNNRQKKQCDCTRPHTQALDRAIREKHLNPRQACNTWKKGKRRCNSCGYIVNLVGHKARCGNNRITIHEDEPPAGQEEQAPEAL